MPGSGKQPPEIQEQIKELLEAGFDPTTIHRRLKVGRSSIYRMKRCLQQHGTNYMPAELNKKNGRPKVLTPAQELEVRDWLRDAKNRGRYLDDLVWLIHDRFGIVCSTTTMSKMKRKWLRVIEFEEDGRELDEATRAMVRETHPALEIVHRPATAGAHTIVPETQMVAAAVVEDLHNHHHHHQPQHEHQHQHQHQHPMGGGAAAAAAGDQPPRHSHLGSAAATTELDEQQQQQAAHHMMLAQMVGEAQQLEQQLQSHHQHHQHPQHHQQHQHQSPYGGPMHAHHQMVGPDATVPL